MDFLAMVHNSIRHFCHNILIRWTECRKSTLGRMGFDNCLSPIYLNDDGTLSLLRFVSGEGRSGVMKSLARCVLAA